MPADIYAFELAWGERFFVEDQIKSLSARLLTCDDPEQAAIIAGALQAAIHAHIEGLRKKLADVPPWPKFPEIIWK